jgi:hypothetical protein
MTYSFMGIWQPDTRMGPARILRAAVRTGEGRPARIGGHLSAADQGGRCGVDHTATPEDFAVTGSELESVVLNRAIKWHAERRVFVNGTRTVVLR